MQSDRSIRRSQSLWLFLLFFCTLVQVMTFLPSHCSAQSISADGYTVKSWVGWVSDSLPYARRFSSSVNIGRFVLVGGGFGEKLDAPHIAATTSISFVDFDRQRSGTPLMVETKTYKKVVKVGNTTKMVDATTSTFKKAELLEPAAGPNSFVVCGGDVYVLGMCSIVPQGKSVLQDGTHIPDFYRSVQRISSIRPPADVEAFVKQYNISGDHGHRQDSGYSYDVPLVDVSATYIPKSMTNGRFNASCKCIGGKIFVVGGVALPTMEETTQVAQYDPMTNNYISAFSMPGPVVNPALAADDQTLYIIGGDHNGTILNDFHFYFTTTGEVSDALGGYPNILGSHLAHMVAINGSVITTGGDFSIMIPHSLWHRSAWPRVQMGHEVGIIESSFIAIPHRGNVSLMLFGGFESASQSVQHSIYQAEMILPAPIPQVAGLAFCLEENVTDCRPPSPPHSDNFAPVSNTTNAPATSAPPHDEVPAVYGNNGNFTNVRGYDAVWYDTDFAIQIHSDSDDGFGILDVCNASIDGHQCVVRLSTNDLCTDFINDEGDVTVRQNFNAFPQKVNITEKPPTDDGATTTKMTNVVRIEGFSIKTYFKTLTSWLPPVQYVVGTGGKNNSASNTSVSNNTIPPQYEIEKLPLVYVCFSSGQKSMIGCANEPCISKFFTPLNALRPLVWSNLSFATTPDHPSSAPPETSSPPPGTQAPNPGHSTKGGGGGFPSYGKYAAIGGGVFILLIVAIVVTLRSRWEKHELEKDALLDHQRGGGGRGCGINPEKTAKDGLLDGRYKILQRLGKGSFSVVYLVERPSDSAKFALKYVQCQDDTDRHEAMKECEVVRKLQGHPNVINLVDMFLSYKFDTNLNNGGHVPSHGGGGYSPTGSAVYDDELASYNSPPKQGAVYSDNFTATNDDAGSNQGERYLSLVMEYHEKGDLGRFVKKQKQLERFEEDRFGLISEPTIISIAYQVCSVLNFMHGKSPPIIHRDLKPENILLSSTKYENVADSFVPVIVTDFGLSRVMDKTFCETGVGSLPYVAPECWQRKYSTKVDIWALGCILYAVATRRVEADCVRVMFSECNRPDFKKTLIADVKECGYSESLGRFLGYLLEPNPETRPAAADALRKIKKRFGPHLRKDLANKQHLDQAALENVPNMNAESQCEYFLCEELERELGAVLPKYPHGDAQGNEDSADASHVPSGQTYTTFASSTGKWHGATPMIESEATLNRSPKLLQPPPAATAASRHDKEAVAAHQRKQTAKKAPKTSPPGAASTSPPSNEEERNVERPNDDTNDAATTVSEAATADTCSVPTEASSLPENSSHTLRPSINTTYDAEVVPAAGGSP